MTVHKNSRLPANLKVQVQERGRRRAKENQGVVKADEHSSVARNDPAPKLRAERWAINRLKDADRRSRAASPEQRERMTRSISQFGILKPVLIDAQGSIVDGHILVEVARRMGLPDIECVVIDHLSPDELRLSAAASDRGKGDCL